MLLTYIFYILLCGITALFFIDSKNLNIIRTISLTITGIVLILSCMLLNDFDSNSMYFQHCAKYSLGSGLMNLTFSVGLDNLSIYFFVLSSLLIFISTLFIWDDPEFKIYMIAILFIELFLLLIFSVLDIFLFYLFFEGILLPMFFLIGIWGSRERKIRAVFLFIFYTICGSILLLVGILFIYQITGSWDLEYILNFTFLKYYQKPLWICFFLAFACKIPMFPFHIWLPEAHVEAPTVGSALLAGILLKLGVYGFLRFSIALCPEASLFFSPLVYLLSILGVIYASMSAIRQTDLKRVIAYSSVAHMNLVTIGIFSFNVLGIEGAILQSISHGFVSGGMFLLIGMLYNRYHTRFIYYYGGLVHMMPVYAIFFLIFTFANIAIPGTSSFVGEFLILAGIYKTNILVCFFSTLGVILCGAYSLWIYNRMIFGNLKIDFTVKFKDMDFKEFLVIIPLFLLIFIMGIYPSLFTESLHFFCSNLFFIIF